MKSSLIPPILRRLAPPRFSHSNASRLELSMRDCPWHTIYSLPASAIAVSRADGWLPSTVYCGTVVQKKLPYINSPPTHCFAPRIVEDLSGLTLTRRAKPQCAQDVDPFPLTVLGVYGKCATASAECKSETMALQNDEPRRGLCNAGLVPWFIVGNLKAIRALAVVLP